jgi:hypothetical protein
VSRNQLIALVPNQIGESRGKYVYGQRHRCIAFVGVKVAGTRESVQVVPGGNKKNCCLVTNEMGDCSTSMREFTEGFDKEFKKKCRPQSGRGEVKLV